MLKTVPVALGDELRQRLVWSDRRQEFVFIGTAAMDEDAIRSSLDAYLVESADFKLKLWRDLPDPISS